MLSFGMNCNRQLSLPRFSSLHSRRPRASRMCVPHAKFRSGLKRLNFSLSPNPTDRPNASAEAHRVKHFVSMCSPHFSRKPCICLSSPTTRGVVPPSLPASLNHRSNFSSVSPDLQTPQSKGITTPTKKICLDLLAKAPRIRREIRVTIRPIFGFFQLAINPRRPADGDN